MHFDASTLQVMDAFVKGFQILFFIVGSVCAVLTYRALKRGWLNTVNTEYQKKVIERLASVAEELASEFDWDSPNYWLKIPTATRELVEYETEIYLRDPHRFKSEKGFGIYRHRLTKEEIRLVTLLRTYKTDPFLPKHLREMIVDLLESRLAVADALCTSIAQEYRQWLLKEPVQTKAELEDASWQWFEKSGKFNTEQRCGITDLEKDVDKIRLEIQRYFESFSPARTRLK